MWCANAERMRVCVSWIARNRNTPVRGSFFFDWQYGDWLRGIDANFAWEGAFYFGHVNFRENYSLVVRLAGWNRAGKSWSWEYNFWQINSVELKPNTWITLKFILSYFYGLWDKKARSTTVGYNNFFIFKSISIPFVWNFLKNKCTLFKNRKLIALSCFKCAIINNYILIEFKLGKSPRNSRYFFHQIASSSVKLRIPVRMWQVHQQTKKSFEWGSRRTFFERHSKNFFTLKKHALWFRTIDFIILQKSSPVKRWISYLFYKKCNLYLL